jgi:glycosyltransferase involved in cell wall biosynthesis
MRILHVITTLDVGGAEMHLLSLVGGQTRRGHRVRVAWLKGRGSLSEDFRAAGAEWTGRVGSGPTLFARLWPHLRWAERVHTHLLKADMAAGLAATLAGRRGALVSSKHNDEQVLKRPAVSCLHGLIGRLPRRTIVLSDHVGRFIERYGRVPPARQTRIYYGLDREPFERVLAPEHRLRLRESLGFGADDFVLVCVARFAAQKAHDVLLKAFRIARDKRTPDTPRLRLLLIGDDPFGDGRVRSEALAAELGLGSDCLFAGIRRDVPELYAISNACVLSSLWEGLGLVFLEAMAAGLPVIATRVSAVPEVVIDGATGLLVEAGVADPLALAMLRLARDGELCRRLGEAGHDRVAEHFDLERMIEQTLAVYTRLG